MTRTRTRRHPLAIDPTGIARSVRLVLGVAADQALDRLAEITGRSRSEVIRDLIQRESAALGCDVEEKSTPQQTNA